MGGLQSGADDRVQPRDNLQKEILNTLSVELRSVASANQMLATIQNLIKKADVAAITSLSKRLSNPGDRFRKYLESRMSSASARRLIQYAYDWNLALNGNVHRRDRTANFSRKGSEATRGGDVAMALIKALRTVAKNGSGERYVAVAKLFESLDFVDALRLYERLNTPKSILRSKMNRALSEPGADRLINTLLVAKAAGLSAEALPENMPTKRAKRLVSGDARLRDLSGRVLRRKTEILRNSAFEELAQRGEAESSASVARNSDILRQSKFPSISLSAQNKIDKLIEKQVKDIRSGYSSFKPYTAKFIAALKNLKIIAISEGHNENDILGIWAAKMHAISSGQGGSILDLWVRKMEGTARAFERHKKDSLARRGYIWIQAVETPGFVEFVLELQRRGELIKLGNFIAAAKGMGDAVVLVYENLKALLDKETWVQMYLDLKAHGKDLFTLDADSIGAIKNQLSRDFEAYAMLDEEQQVRIAARVGTSIIIDRKLGKAIKEAGEQRLGSRKLNGGQDSGQIPRATASVASPKHLKTIKTGLKNPGAYEFLERMGVMTKRGARNLALPANRWLLEAVDKFYDKKGFGQVIKEAALHTKIKKAGSGNVRGARFVLRYAHDKFESTLRIEFEVPDLSTKIVRRKIDMRVDGEKYEFKSVSEFRGSSFVGTKKGGRMKQLDDDLNDHLNQVGFSKETKLHWVFDQKHYGLDSAKRKRTRIVKDIKSYLRKNSEHRKTPKRLDQILDLVDKIVEVWPPESAPNSLLRELLE